MDKPPFVENHVVFESRAIQTEPVVAEQIVINRELTPEKSKGDARMAKINDLVILGIFGWVAGSSWNLLIRTLFSTISTTWIKVVAVFVWACAVTVIFAAVIYFTVKE